MRRWVIGNTFGGVWSSSVLIVRNASIHRLILPRWGTLKRRSIYHKITTESTTTGRTFSSKGYLQPWWIDLIRKVASSPWTSIKWFNACWHGLITMQSCKVDWGKVAMWGNRGHEKRLWT
jgi:hypothetical protein